MAYFPNSTAGEVLDAQCADCPLGYGWNDPNQPDLFDVEREPRQCPVALVQMLYNYNQIRGQACDHVAKHLQEAETPNLPEKVDGIGYGSSEMQMQTAIAWLRSNDFRDAMNLLINDEGECQVRKQLVEIRKESE